MISISIIITTLWTHWLGDFLLQSNYQALNKNKNNLALLLHVFLYSLSISVISIFFSVSFVWVLLNAFLHGLVDYITSRITYKLYVKNNRYAFFVVIGLDQCIHIIILFYTMDIFLN